jgi:serine/threonine kinase PknH
MAVHELTPGDPPEIGGYRLRGRLGAGGMGVVYLAFTPGGRPVALKVVRPEFGDDAAFRARFRQEVAAARRVHGMFTAQLLDADPDGSPPWLVAAYVAGPSLAQAVAEHGPLPAGSVLALVAGVAEALAAIHEAGVVHRDLKPSNVLLAADGPRVIDFGIARAAEATELTQTGIRVGSPHYMSPEQVRGGAVSAAADVWALGAVAVFAATGRPAFGEGSEQAVMYRVLHEEPDLTGCPDAVRAVIGGCLARDPAARPSPSQLIESCRSGAAAGTVEFAGGWLPPALAADLPGHAAPAATAWAAGASTVPPPPVPAGPGYESPPTAVLQPPVSAAPGLVPGVSAASQPTMPGTVPAGAATTRTGRRRVSRSTLIAGLAAVAVIAAAAGLGATLLPGRFGPSPGPRSSASGRAPGSANGSRARDAGTGGTGKGAGSKDAATGRTSSHGGGGSKAAGSAASLDPCLVGTWTSTSTVQDAYINGNLETFIGSSGMTEIYQANGDAFTQYKNATYTAEINGNSWQYVVNGTITNHVATKDGQELNSDATSSGTYQFIENGTPRNSGSLEASPLPTYYTCSATSLTETTPGAGGDSMVRVG